MVGGRLESSRTHYHRIPPGDRREESGGKSYREASGSHSAPYNNRNRCPLSVISTNSKPIDCLSSEVILSSLLRLLWHSSLLYLKTEIRMSIVPSIFGRRSSVYDPFSFDTWDPFSSLISDFEPSRQLAQDVSAVANTRIDWKETPEAHLFKADVPGLKKEEVKVEVEEGRILKISGERSKEEEQKTDKWHRIERSHGRFQRRFRLPENVKVDELKASLENGVLTVTVPKQPEPKPEVKTIEIGGSG